MSSAGLMAAKKDGMMVDMMAVMMDFSTVLQMAAQLAEKLAVMTDFV
jgi:hypothetical protein